MLTLMLEPPLEPCRSYAFLYPSHDLLESRRVFVTRIHDVTEGRSTRPQWLITGTDLERKTEVSLQFMVMQDVKPLCNADPGLLPRSEWGARTELDATGV